MLAKTTEEALALWHWAKEQQLKVPDDSADYKRAATAMLELEQVISMLSDADLLSVDVLARASETVHEARLSIANVGETAVGSEASDQ